jgi:hypothetical protein
MSSAQWGIKSGKRPLERYHLIPLPRRISDDGLGAIRGFGVVLKFYLAFAFAVIGIYLVGFTFYFLSSLVLRTFN